MLEANGILDLTDNVKEASFEKSLSLVKKDYTASHYLSFDIFESTVSFGESEIDIRASFRISSKVGNIPIEDLAEIMCQINKTLSGYTFIKERFLIIIFARFSTSAASVNTSKI